MSRDSLSTSGDLQDVFRDRPRPAPVRAPAAVVTLGWRALLKIKHVPFQLFDVTVMPIMFTLLFTFMFGGAMERSLPEGTQYINFLLPGILVQTIIFITVYTGVGLNTDIQKGLFDRFRSLPMWQPAPILGALAGDLFRYTMASIVILVIGFTIGFRPEGGVLGVLGAFGLVLVTAFSLSWIWIIFGMRVKTPESVMTTSFIFLMPLTFASNIFVPLETLPGWLEPIVAHNPVTHLASAARALTTGEPVGNDLWWVLGTAAAITVVFSSLAMAMYRKER